MMKKSKPLLHNKFFGHFLAGLFFLVVGYFFYSAATNMNYVWKWTSVPKYFVYDEVITIQSPADGTLATKDGAFFIKSKEQFIKLENLNTSFKFDYVIDENIYKGDTIATKETIRAGPVLNGLYVTIKVSVFAALLSVIIGVVISTMKLSSYIFLRDIATVYITIIRGTPLLVQIFLFYFIVANIFGLERFTAGVLSLGVFFGAYMAEILRGAIQSIDKGQTEAAKSLGLNMFDTMRYIVMPQAIKRALPTLVGEFIALVKDSSLISVISITDLTKVGKEIVANTFSPFETWIVIALLYLTITSLLSFIGHKIEKRLKEKGGIS
ncbi:MAG: amino acid ABC transporter permease [Epsilonproteobacteria bacterium]|nr:MAG: amino acid ABC transporter permease [Campylobacterota bacterium]